MPKRGLIALVVIWALLLFVPAFQTQTRQMIRLPFFGGAGADNSFSQLLNEDPAKGLSSDNPQLKIAELQTKVVANINQYWRDWDALMAKYPDNLNLRRARLVAATRKGSLVRPIYQPTDKSGRVASNEEKQWQNDAQRAATARAARVGEKLAPNDSFFPWMEAMALWNRDDEAALQALARAGKDTDFNDGVMANQRALLKLREKQYAPDAVGKLAVILSALLPHCAEMRELAREVTWSGIARYRRGDKAGAYRRWRIAMQAGGAFRRGESHGPQSILIGLYVAQACQHLVWETVALELNAPARIGGIKPSQDALLRAFETLAKRDGHSDLAVYAARENAAFEARKLGVNSSDIVTEMGLYSPPTQTALQLPLAARIVFWLSIAGALGLLVCLIWRRFVGGARWYRASAAQIAFFGALWVGALALAVWARAIGQAQDFGGNFNNPAPLAPWLSELLNPSWSFWLCIAATLLGAGALCYWQNAREKERLQNQILPPGNAATAGAWLPKVIGIAWILVLLSTIAWFAVAGNRDNALLASGVWFASSLLALALTLWQTEIGASNKRQSRLAIVGAIFLLAMLGLAVQFGLRSDVGDATFYVIGLCFLAAVFIALYLGVEAKAWRAEAPAALAVALQTLGGVAVICSIVLFIASLAALPVRARQNRVVDDYIARGEIDWMRAQPEIRNAGATTNEN